MSSSVEDLRVTGGHPDCYYSNLSQPHKIMTTIGTVMSLLSYGILFYLYQVDQQPCLRRHPSNIMFYKCVMEFIYIYQFLFTPWVDDGFNWNQYTVQCKCSNTALFFSFQSQFSLLGSELYFLALVWDLHTQCSNPFASFKQNARFYNACIYGVSIFMACLLLVIGGSNQWIGSGSNYGIWVQDYDSLPDAVIGATTTTLPETQYQAGRRHHNLLDASLIKVFMFYMWLTVIYLYALYVIRFVSARLNEGLARTLQTRGKLARRARKYVIGYTCFWFLVGVMDFVHSVLAAFQNDKDKYEPMHVILSFLISGRGFASLLIVYYANQDEWVPSKFLYYLGVTDSETPRDGQNIKASRAALKEEIASLPHLNSTLRAEVILFTTQGILYCIVLFCSALLCFSLSFDDKSNCKHIHIFIFIIM
jgi:hypothetical protein